MARFGSARLAIRTRFTRGATVVLRANTFLDSTGASLTPDSVSVYLDYQGANRQRVQVTVSLSNSSGEWSAEWDSSIAYPGTVFASMKAVSGSEKFVIDDQFQLTTNIANPNPA